LAYLLGEVARHCWRDRPLLFAGVAFRSWLFAFRHSRSEGDWRPSHFRAHLLCAMCSSRGASGMGTLRIGIGAIGTSCRTNDSRVPSFLVFQVYLDPSKNFSLRQQAGPKTPGEAVLNHFASLF